MCACAANIRKCLKPHLLASFIRRMVVSSLMVEIVLLLWPFLLWHIYLEKLSLIHSLRPNKSHSIIGVWNEGHPEYNSCHYELLQEDEDTLRSEWSIRFTICLWFLLSIVLDLLSNYEPNTLLPVLIGKSMLLNFCDVCRLKITHVCLMNVPFYLLLNAPQTGLWVVNCLMIPSHCCVIPLSIEEKRLCSDLYPLS